MLWHAISPSRGYTKAANELIRSQRLSSDAKILLLYVQGLPADRRGVALSEHARTLGITGRAYQKAKHLLIAHGYLHEWRRQGGRGFWATEQLLANVVLTPEEARGARDGGPVAPVPLPGARKPMVGQPGGRSVGGQEPVEEEREKNSSHPPTEPAEPSQESACDEPEAAEAERVLLSLRHTHRSLHLGVAEARKLVKLAVVWLRRGVTAGEMRQVLTGDLPADGVRSAVGFLRHRLVQKLPEEPPPAPRPEPAPPVAPLVVCAGPGEEHLFRPHPDDDDGTRCGACRRAAARAVWAEAERARIAADEAGLVDADGDSRARTPWRERFAAVRGAGADADMGVPGR
ncbi:hypothetical protein OG488_18225 [Streptomyces sp. NBC_01460]|uniref:hypothetical protein n=1 Tax=Streptomyces sp. NBC_01460 TaxID=2903875 RepID=UPI002E33827B|nr:hypothetical protein [Streptomyces sp. NBC_01460]